MAYGETNKRIYQRTFEADSGLRIPIFTLWRERVGEVENDEAFSFSVDGEVVV
jgi:hypothetical protein